MKHFYFTLGWNPKLVGYGLRRPAPIVNILNSNRVVFVQIVKYFTGDELNPNSKGQKKWAKSLSFFPIMFMKHFYFTLGWTPKLVGSGLRSTAPIVHILNSNRFVFEIFHNLDKNKTIWIQNVNNWCSTTETRTHKFWSSPQCEIKMLHENYRKKRKWFRLLFLSFSIRVELIAREIFHNLDKNKTVWIQNVNNWCSTTETITYKFWVSPQCEIKMLYENYRRKRKSFSITFLCPFELGLSSSPVSKLWNISRAMSSTLIEKDKKSKRNHFLFFR